MSVYIFLFMAVACEVLGTMLLPASQNFTKALPTTIMVLSWVVSVYFLTLTIEKLPLAVVYASWSGLGVFTIAILSYVFYKQNLSWQAVVGLFLIVIGVTIVNIFKS